MKVCIIGWYGTETIGDRAILAGIFSMLHRVTGGSFSVELGSLYPYFSQRTLQEDAPFYEKTTGKHIDVSLFDSRVVSQLDEAISRSDLVAVGGGPLMHINAMFMLEYAFRRARKLGKKTMLWGCGAGPLHKTRHQRAAVALAENSDIIVMRDAASVNNLQELYKKFGKRWPEEKVKSSLDPSVQCLLDFQSYQRGRNPSESGYIAVNFRSFPGEYAGNKSRQVNEALFAFLGKLPEKFPGRRIRLIPMNYFHIGNDDRDFLNTLALRLHHPDVEVQNANLTMEQTMEVYQNAFLNVGMRFHSVVFQTVLNGRNIILDYTEPQKGKISGFLADVNGYDFYRTRYVNLQTMTSGIPDLDNPDIEQRFHFDNAHALSKLKLYEDVLKILP